MTGSRLIYGILSAAALCAAVVILLIVGLPDRADYTAVYLAPNARPVAAEIDAYAPQITGETLDGSVFDLYALRGSPVIINFWATWCVPCRVEMPELQALYTAERAAGVRVVGVNLDDDRAAVAAWVSEFDLTFDIVLNNGSGRASLDYRLRGQPTTVIVSADGIIRQIFHGAVDMNVLRSTLKGL